MTLTFWLVSLAVKVEPEKEIGPSFQVGKELLHLEAHKIGIERLCQVFVSLLLLAFCSITLLYSCLFSLNPNTIDMPLGSLGLYFWVLLCQAMFRLSLIRWLFPLIPARGRLRQEFEVSLGYKILSLNQQTK